MGKSKKTSGESESSGQDLRNTKIMVESMSGKTQGEIAEEFGLSRARVNLILNSAESQKLAKESRSEIQRMLSLAVTTLRDAMECRVDDMKTAVNAATTVLKGAGILTDKIDIPQLKPFIVKLRDGSEIHMGHKPQDAEGGNNGEEEN